MSGLAFGAAASDEDLRQILALQRRNVEEALPPEEVARDGFVTVRHDFELLRDMNRIEPHVVARDAGRVVGYTVMMRREFEARIPILEPMYRMLTRISYAGRAVSEYRYFIMGQVCVDRDYRGRGVFAGLYRALRDRYAGHYELVITEVARRNGRSIRAHEKVGFRLLHRYRDSDGEEWDVIVWDWRPGGASGSDEPGSSASR